MLAATVRDEFVFNGRRRKPSERTIRNYSKQIGYLLSFLEEKQITDIEHVQAQNIKQYCQGAG